MMTTRKNLLIINNKILMTDLTENWILQQLPAVHTIKDLPIIDYHVQILQDPNYPQMPVATVITRRLLQDLLQRI